MRKKMVTTGLALGLVAGAGAGMALDIAGSAGAAGTVTAVTTPTDPATPTSTPAAPAAPTDGTRPDPGTRLQATLQPLIDKGTITQAQADAVIAALKSAMPAGRAGGGGPRGGGMGGGGFGHGADGASLDVVASTIGITAADLRTALQSGQTIAAVATAHGKTADEVIAAVVADRTTKINADVTAGTITQAEADKRLADLQARVTEQVNNTRPTRGTRKAGGAPAAPAPAGADTGTTAPSTTTGS
jgi:hypothetical protein